MRFQPGPGAARIAHAVRSYGRIDNNLRWCRDVAFGEDQCRVRVDNAAQKFTLLRRIVMSLLRQDRITMTCPKTIA